MKKDQMTPWDAILLGPDLSCVLARHLRVELELCQTGRTTIPSLLHTGILCTCKDAKEVYRSAFKEEGILKLVLRGSTSSVSYSLIPHATRHRFLPWAWRASVTCLHATVQTLVKIPCHRLVWYTLENRWSPCDHCFEYFVGLDAIGVFEELWKARPQHVPEEEWEDMDMASKMKCLSFSNSLSQMAIQFMLPLDDVMAWVRRVQNFALKLASVSRPPSLRSPCK